MAVTGGEGHRELATRICVNEAVGNGYSGTDAGKAFAKARGLDDFTWGANTATIKTHS